MGYPALYYLKGGDVGVCGSRYRIAPHIPEKRAMRFNQPHRPFCLYAQVSLLKVPGTTLVHT